MDDKRILFRGAELWSGFPDHTAAVRNAVSTFGGHIDHHPNVVGVTRDQILEQLHGRDLACWCPLVTELGVPAPCHADVLLAIANPGPVSTRSSWISTSANSAPTMKRGLAVRHDGAHGTSSSRFST